MALAVPLAPLGTAVAVGGRGVEAAAVGLDPPVSIILVLL